MSQGLIFTQDALEKYVRDRKKLDIPIKITSGVPSILGAEEPKALIEKGLAGSQVILSQDNIDALLGSQLEVSESLAFGSSAMVANDTLGLVLACGGQVKSVDLARSTKAATASGLVEASTSLPDSAFTGLEVLVTGAGNLAIRYQETNITAAATNDFLLLELYLRLK